MILVRERLAGCTAESLDSYLRGLGFFLLAGEVDPSVRSWWDEDGVLWLAFSSSFEDLAARVIDSVRSAPPMLRMPWRGADGRDRDFVDVRNEADDAELDWFDSCVLARASAGGATSTEGRERSDRKSNPLLGAGGAFGNAKPQDAYIEALNAIGTAKVPIDGLIASLLGIVRGEPASRRLTQQLSTKKAVLGVYQSGRATVAGASMRDIEPTKQTARSSVWDIVLVFTGLRLFRGEVTRRADPRARVQASFPFLVRSRPIGTGPGRVHELRADDTRAFELLAPLWSSPCTPRTLRRLVSSARLRLRSGIAQDTLDAVLVQASRAAHGLGFDRLVRFALVVGADPRYRFAVRRGEVHALGLGAARLALEEIVPFLRNLEREVARRGGKEPVSLALARRRLGDALAAFGRRSGSSTGLSTSEAASTQEALIALAELQTPAAWAVTQPGRPLEPPHLSGRWFRHADDRSHVFRLARSLLSGLSDDRATLVRETLLPQRREDDRFALDPARTPPDLERVSDPLAVLVHLVLAAIRRTRPRNLARAGSTSFDDLAVLLSEALGREGERRLALLCVALADIHPSGPPVTSPEDPATFGIGADVARLLLAAQPAASVASADRPTGVDEAPADTLEHTTTLASLLVAGRVDAARQLADRELRRRGLDLLPLPPRLAPSPRPAVLAFAVLLPFDEQARSTLERVVTVLPVTTEGGSA